MIDLTGQELGRYRILSPLGRGGMAAVFRAFDPKMHREVALKVLPPEMAKGDPDFVARFEREAQVIAKLDHPNIVSVFDFGESEEFTYMVMPLLGGGVLRGRLSLAKAENRFLPLDEVSRILSEVASALSYAHSRKVVHRDLKPSNVLIDEQGRCRLADFGIARILESSPRLTQEGATMGTPQYMSPEQALGQEVDLRTDIYSLGVVLYELLTNTVPFDAETPLAVLMKHVHNPLPLPRERRPELSVASEQVVLTALAKSADERWSDAIEMAAAFDDAQSKSADGPLQRAPASGEIGGPAVGKRDVTVESPATVAAVEGASSGRRRARGWRSVAAAFLAIGLAVTVLAVLAWLGVGNEESPAIPWRRIPAGSFEMGCSHKPGWQCDGDETPLHEVRISRSFELAETETTNAQYRQCVEAEKCQPPEDRTLFDDESLVAHPVVRVSWQDAVDFCELVGGRLPTEAEWEYAARGGLSSSPFPWGESIGSQYANYRGIVEDAWEQTSEVRAFRANGYGLFDMAGNVWEWIADFYSEGYYSTYPNNDPSGPKNGARRVIRGGSWANGWRYLRVSGRFGLEPETRRTDLGFRCARTAP